MDLTSFILKQKGDVSLLLCVAGFLNLGTIDIFGWIIPCHGRLSVPCKMFGRSLTSTLITHITPFPPSYPKMSPDVI